MRKGRIESSAEVNLTEGSKNDKMQNGDSSPGLNEIE